MAPRLPNDVFLNKLTELFKSNLTIGSVVVSMKRCLFDDFFSS